jgi:hypothetical protein
MRWAGHVEPKGGKRNAYRILVRKPEGTRPEGRLRWVKVKVKISLLQAMEAHRVVRS